MTGHTFVYAVTVTERMDGLYIFHQPSDAHRFMQAVLEAGGEATITEEPVNDSSVTNELIAQELDG